MRQALELALDWIQKQPEETPHSKYDLDTRYVVLRELEAALAQPEQEPVAYINIEERKLEWAYKYMSWDTPTVVNLPKIPLYTTPPQRTWVGLTDDEIAEVENEYLVDYRIPAGSAWNFARDIEAKLKKKNNG